MKNSMQVNDMSNMNNMSNMGNMGNMDNRNSIQINDNNVYDQNNKMNNFSNYNNVMMNNNNSNMINSMNMTNNTNNFNNSNNQVLLNSQMNPNMYVYQNPMPYNGPVHITYITPPVNTQIIQNVPNVNKRKSNQNVSYNQKIEDKSVYTTNPIIVLCPSCKNENLTTVELSLNWTNYYCYFLTTPLCWCAYQIYKDKDFSCNDAQHYCSNCGRQHHKYKACDYDCNLCGWFSNPF